MQNGSLSETFDEMGHKYQLPLYCLSKPENLINENHRMSKKDQIDDQTRQGPETTLRVRISDQK